MVRGTGKYKTRRGGGRNFSKDMVLDQNGTAVARSKIGTDDEGEEEDEDEDDEEESADDAPETNAAQEPELTRAERRELKKKLAGKTAGKIEEEAPPQGEEEEDPDLINPNHVDKKLTISDPASPPPLSRREREQKEKQEAKDRYWKLHEQGKTDQAKADLARLAKVRKDREEAQAKRKAEAEAKAAELAAKKGANTATSKRKI